MIGQPKSKEDIVMSLIICPECKKTISNTANSCPNCGYNLKEQKTQKGCGIGCLAVIIIFAILYMVGVFSADSKKTETSNPKSPEESRKEQIEKQFSAWDGSHIGLTAFIKKAMNDPDSYKNVKTTYWGKGDYLVVKTIFRGKNKFGGVVTNWIMAQVDLNGNVFEVLSEGEGEGP